MKNKIIIIIISIIIVLAAVIFFNLNENPEEQQINSHQKLSSSEILALNLILDGEYKIQAISWKVIDNFGRLPLFLEISQQQNIELIKLIYNRNNLSIPKDNWIINIENFNSTKRACSAGLDQENRNLGIYNEFYSRLKDKDVINLFNIIRQVSEENIIKFQRCD